jgi:sugar-specific transcriptional regulator TrmB
MSNEWIIKTLIHLGLKESDAEIYIFLAKNGSQEIRDIASSMKLDRRRLYLSLKNLQNKGAVVASEERPSRFSAVLFEKVLASFLVAKREQEQNLQNNKNDLLSIWRSFIERDFCE